MVNPGKQVDSRQILAAKVAGVKSSKQSKILDELVGNTATIGVRKDSYLSKPVHQLPNNLNVRTTGNAFLQNHGSSQSTTQRATTAAAISHAGQVNSGKQKLESFVTPRKDQFVFNSGNAALGGNNGSTNANGLKRPMSSKASVSIANGEPKK